MSQIPDSLLGHCYMHLRDESVHIAFDHTKPRIGEQPQMGNIHFCHYSFVECQITQAFFNLHLHCPPIYLKHLILLVSDIGVFAPQFICQL